MTLENSHERMEFLERACHGNRELLAEVLSLIEAAGHSSILDQPVTEVELLSAHARGISPTLRIGRYQITRLLGHGGMGSVYEAQQTTPVLRRVAMKLIRIDQQSQETQWRFQLEQKAQASLDHPNIARVLDVSREDEGLAYIVMEYVDGKTIAEFCDHRIDLAARLDLFRQCCLAIQHAHQMAIVHRDIKPSNVLVTMIDGRPTVKLIDFGIAKLLDRTSKNRLHPGYELTDPGNGPGTPAYTSPEQINGSSAIDTRSDIYSLGALLYVLLSGKPPFDFSTNAEWTPGRIAKTISESTPVLASSALEARQKLGETAPPHTITPRQLRGDLDCIIRKAMHPSPSRRYQNVSRLLEDLDRHSDGRPVLARPDTLAYVLSRLVWRHKTIFLSVLALMAGTAALLYQANRAIRSENQLARQSYATDLLLASFAIENQDSFEASRALARHAPQRGESPRFEWKFLNALCRRPSDDFFQAGGAIYYLCRMPHGHEIVSCGKEGLIRFHDAETGKVRLTIDAGQGEVNGVAVTGDGTKLASAGDDGTIALWDPVTGKRLASFRAHQRQAFQVAWSRDQKWLATCGNEADVQIWDAASFQRLSTLTSRGKDLECVAVDTQNNLAFGTEGGSVVLLTPNPDTGLPAERRDQQASWYGRVPAGQCSTLAFSPVGDIMAAGRETGSLVLQQISQPEGLYREFPMNEAVWAINFSPGGDALAVGEKDGSITTFRLPSYLLQAKLVLSPELRNAAGVPASLTSADGPHPFLLQSTPECNDGIIPAGTTSIRLVFSEPLVNADQVDFYRLEFRSTPAQSEPNETTCPDSVEVDGATITLNFSGLSSLSDADTSQDFSTWQAHDRSVTAICYSPDGRWLISSDSNGLLRRFPSGQEEMVRQVNSDVLASFDLKNERYLVINNDRKLRISEFDFSTEHSSSADRSVDVFNSVEWALLPGEVVSDQNGQKIYLANGDENSHGRGISSLSLSTGSLTSLWRPTADERVRTLVGPCDGSRLVVELNRIHPLQGEESNGRFAILDLNSLQETASFDCRLTYGKLLSPDGRWMAAQSGEGLHLADLDSATIRTVFYKPKATITGFAFSPDNSELAVAFADRAIRILQTSSAEVIAEYSSQGCAASSIAWTADGKSLATVGVDGYLRCWSRDLLQLTMVYRLPSRNLTQLRFALSGDMASILDRNGRMFVLRTQDQVR